MLRTSAKTRENIIAPLKPRNLIDYLISRSETNFIIFTSYLTEPTIEHLAPNFYLRRSLTTLILEKQVFRNYCETETT